MNMVEEALAIALEAHRGQTGKSGEPYILHPLRVMCAMESSDEQVVAILHDVVEDSAWTIEQLRERGFPDNILKAVDALTRREGEAYDAFVLRAGANQLARRVKFADLRDNMDLRRLAAVTEKDAERLARYVRAWHTLKALPPAGRAE